MCQPSARRAACRSHSIAPEWIDLVRGILLLACLAAWNSVPVWAADLEQAQKLFRTGRYDDCARMAGEELAKGGWNEDWDYLKIEAELARGKYSDALATLEGALRRFRGSIRLRLLGREVYRYNGQDADAAAELSTIERLILRSPREFAAPESRVALGRYFLLQGAEARTVLEQFYDAVIKEHPDFTDAYLATAELGLDKQDFALAATTLSKAPKQAAADPRYQYLLARALESGDHAGSAKALAEALKINPRHVESLLFQAEDHIDAERYQEAEKVLKQVFEVNPLEPRAWAFRAVLAHLRNDRTGEDVARHSALSRWGSNPEVDHLIGRKLSQKYRFAEGSASQRRSLELDAEYLPAKIQLCQDLLRLGEEAQGWKLAAEIFTKDAYNVVAYNLVTLRDNLAGFRALERDGFVVRMEKREADLYGDRVLALLGRARKTLCTKYGVILQQPVIVEIFPHKKEFAVRTFGLPGADGFLGVCFGRVITANSPASQGEHPSNWEAVLWHESCHVVTLSKTHNKMPRWLSEGISVYEEGCEDRTWGGRMNPRYRPMMVGDELTPLSRLSGAFLAPKTPLHLQFAYYESSLAVDFLIRQFGMPVLKVMLEDLGTGVPINETLPRRTKKTLEQLDHDFAQFVRARAESVAPGLTWEEPDLPADANSAAIAAWVEDHPKSFWGWRRLGARLINEEQWPRAIEVLEKLKELYPEYVGPENAYMLLATVYRRRSDQAAEHKVLEQLAERDGDASAAYLRLMELDQAAGDWQGVAKNARRLLAVNPLIPNPYRQLASASEHLGDRGVAMASYRALALLDDTDPAFVHYQLAKLLSQDGKRVEARREVLKSLEEAPRFLEAHRLLLELADPVAAKADASRPRSPRSGPEGPMR
jgi:tetratricopeptide (TPR) repeat protein